MESRSSRARVGIPTRKPPPDARPRANGWRSKIASTNWSVRIDGTEHQRFTENRVFDNHPSWSPDGRRIAFLAGGYLDNRVMPRLHTMAPDGSDRQVLGTRGVATVIRMPPQWSPDGKHVRSRRRRRPGQCDIQLPVAVQQES